MLAYPIPAESMDIYDLAFRKILDSLSDPLLGLVQSSDQRAIPMLAKTVQATGAIEEIIQRLPTRHRLYCGDSRQALEAVPDHSVHLIVTSPPYWNLKEYPEAEGQMGAIDDFDEFLEQLESVSEHILRVLVPGGRMVIVVGDVLVPRRRFGRHVVFPLHAAIQEQCRHLGFDNLAPIIWYKIGNAQFEVTGGNGRFLGKPYEPNAVIKNDIEYLLFQRKPGGYRQPTMVTRVLSVIPEKSHREWFQQIWNLPGASTRKHPAPYPLALAERFIRMFSFVGDTILDPFMGTGTTNLAAARWGRHSLGFDVEPSYVSMARERLEGAAVGATIDTKEV